MSYIKFAYFLQGTLKYEYILILINKCNLNIFDLVVGFPIVSEGLIYIWQFLQETTSSKCWYFMYVVLFVASILM